MNDRLGSIVIIIKERKSIIEKVNSILSEHSNIILARLGLPFKEKNLSIINLIVNGNTDEIGALTGKIGKLPNVTIKSVLAKE